MTKKFQKISKNRKKKCPKMPKNCKQIMPKGTLVKTNIVVSSAERVHIDSSKSSTPSGWEELADVVIQGRYLAVGSKYGSSQHVSATGDLPWADSRQPPPTNGSIR